MKSLTKKQYIAFVLILLVLSFLFGGLISLIGMNNYSSTYINQNVYSNANFDFIIPSPGKTQIDTLESKNFIEDVCPYYTTTINANISSKNVETYIYFVDDVYDFVYSPFCEDRIVETKDINGNNVAFVDYIFSKKNGVNIGDHVVIGGKSYVIEKIYKPNSLTANGCMAICWDNELKSNLKAIDSNYSGAWLKSNALTECDDYLKSYIPEGRIRKQGENETIEQYQKYLTDFYSADFYKEITNISANKQISDAKIDTAKKAVITEQIIAGVLIMFSILVGLYYVYFSGKQKLRIKKAIQANTNNYFSLKKTLYCKSVFLPLIAYFIMSFIVCVFKYMLGSFFDINLLSSLLIVLCTMLFITCLGVLLINKLLLDRNYKAIKTKKDN